jgi:hypothetical protein
VGRPGRAGGGERERGEVVWRKGCGPMQDTMHTSTTVSLHTRANSDNIANNLKPVGPDHTTPLHTASPRTWDVWSPMSKPVPGPSTSRFPLHAMCTCAPPWAAVLPLNWVPPSRCALHVFVLPPLPRDRPPPDCHALFPVKVVFSTTRRPPGPKYSPPPKAGTVACVTELPTKEEEVRVTTVLYLYGQYVVKLSR